MRTPLICVVLGLAAIALFSMDQTRRGPGDVESLNRFAAEYNRYAEELRGGVVDVKQWGRVEKAWSGLGSQAKACATTDGK